MQIRRRDFLATSYFRWVVWYQSSVMPSANFRRIAHKLRYFVQAFAIHRQLRVSRTRRGSAP
jgi:hypothetical protein